MAFLAVALAATVFARAEPPDDDPFADTNKAPPKPATLDKTLELLQGDPFADINKAPPKSAALDKTLDLLQLEAGVEPKEARPGQVVRLTIKGTLKDGYHTYPISQYSEDPIQGESNVTALEFGPSPAFRPLPPVTETEPEFAVGIAGGVLLEYKKPFTWSQDVLILPDAPAGEQQLSFVLKLFVCDEHACVPGTRRMSVPVKVAGAPVPLTPELEKRLREPAPGPKAVPVPANLRDKMSTYRPGTATAVSPVTTAAGPSVGLIHQLGIALFQGFIMLLTPCVFPMIPVTVSFFLKQGEKEHHNPLTLATVYSGTIFILLTLAVLVLGKIIIDLANNVWLNLGMGLILMYFALSLFGMYEIELPSFLTRFTSAREGQGGYVGAFFMALTFTINSFTCTGPFLGPLLSGIKELRLSFPELVANAAAYAAGFSGPFFILALFPRLLKSLPKSGGWLNSTKVVMGFVEVALALKFLSITDAGLNPGDPKFFNYETVLCVWMALAVACGLYLFGVFRLPHDSPVQSIGVMRLMLATFFLGFAVYMSPLLSRRTPQGPVGEFLVAWLPQDTAPAAVPAGGEKASSELAWSSDYESAWEQARKDGKLLFIDFTGFNCQNCRYNEKNVFPRPEVRNEIAKFVRVRLYTDLVPNRSLTPTQAKDEALRNRGWEENTFQNNSLPLYAVLDPSRATKPVTDDGKLGGVLKGQAEGLISDVPAFVSILQNAQEKRVARAK
jgi:thiol:disulfide interchange protein DsbD